MFVRKKTGCSSAMSVSSHAQPDVVTIEGEASLREVATKLDDENVGTVVVVEGDEPLGNSYQRFFEEREDAGTTVAITDKWVEPRRSR